MSDLVDELYASDQASALTNRAARHIEAQAKEIAETRAANDRCEELFKQMQAEAEAQAKEIAELRAALEEAKGRVFGTVGECLAGMLHSEVSETARRKIERAIDRAFYWFGQGKATS